MTHFHALRDLILRSRPVTPADAVVQLLVCHGFLYEAMTVSNAEAANDQELIHSVLSGAARCIAEYHGLPLGELGGTYYATGSEENWPDINLADAQRKPIETWGRAMDGTVTEWER